MSTQVVNAVSLASAAIVLAGCHSGRSVVGTWTSSGPDVAAGTTLTATFTEPDKVKWVMESASTGSPFRTEMAGTYKLEGHTITIHFDRVSTTTPSAKLAADPKWVKFNHGLDAQMLDMLNHRGGGELMWVDDDHFTITTGQPKQTEKYARASGH